MSLIKPVFSLCKSLNNKWLWAAWASPRDAITFLRKTNKNIVLDCYFWAEADSQELAIQTAHKILGPFAEQTNCDLAEEVGKLVYESSWPSPVVQAAQPANSNSLEQSLNDLNSLVGLDSVKSTVQELYNLAKVSKLRASLESVNAKTLPITRHLVFTGNPGTGKTTVARMIGQVYQNLGVLSKGHFIEIDRSNLVGEYVGHTAPKTTAVVKSAIGGVLFIDEAYSLVPEGNKDIFGQEAISTLLRLMVDHQDDLVVIVAGYKEDMSRFINSNPGLKSRFSRFINFPDYSTSELTEIFKVRCQENGFIAPEPVFELIYNLALSFESKIGELGNGRFIKNVLDRCIVNHANRLASAPSPSPRDLQTFTLADIPTSEQLRQFLI